MSFSTFNKAVEHFSKHGSSINANEIKELIDLGSNVEKFNAVTIENNQKYNDEGIVFSFEGENIYFVRDNFENYFSSYNTGYKKVNSENLTQIEKSPITIQCPKNKDELFNLKIVPFVSQFNENDIVNNFSNKEIKSAYDESNNYRLKTILDKLDKKQKSKVKFKR